MNAYVSWSIEAEELFDDEGNEYSGDDYALIEKVYVPSADRGNGIGSKMLRETIAEIQATHPEMTIKLAALPFDDCPMDMCELVEYYERFGFSVTNTEGHAVIMEL